MPYRALEIDEVAEYLHLRRDEVEHLTKTSDIPHERRGGRVVFRRGEIDAWASQRILALPQKRLADYHQQSTRGTRPLLTQEAFIPELLRPAFIAAELAAKTKRSVMHELVCFAEQTGRVLDASELLESVTAREALCSTGLPGGLALLHCRHHSPYRFEESFLVCGRTVQAIPFGAPDGRPTRIFFLVCCHDERLHLHTLARICLIAQKTDAIARLYAAADAAAMWSILVEAEQTALAGKKSAASTA